LAATLQNRDAEARALFGLLAEEYDPHARRQVGNFPQAFSHLALVRTALNLHEVGSAQRREPESSPLATSMRSVFSEGILE
jgi:glucoamylase